MPVIPHTNLVSGVDARDVRGAGPGVELGISVEHTTLREMRLDPTPGGYAATPTLLVVCETFQAGPHSVRIVRLE